MIRLCKNKSKTSSILTNDYLLICISSLLHLHRLNALLFLNMNNELLMTISEKLQQASRHTQIERRRERMEAEQHLAAI